MAPHQIEQHLRSCVTELTKSEQQLASARDVEVEAEQVYQAAKRQAMLSPECPRVERGSVTVADRDAWVEEQCASEWADYRAAQVTLQAAQDHQRTVRDVTSTYQSIASLCRTALSLAGTT